MNEISAAENFLAHVGAIAEVALLDFIVAEGEHPVRLFEAMRYSLMAGGKRIRPAFTIAVARALGKEDSIVLPAACALEMIHTYSLIHDDLPAMDNDDYRRGKPTNHRIFGEATAIIAGDTLLTCAFSLLSNKKNHQGVAPKTMLAVIAVITEATGIKGMAGGQMLDILAEKGEVGGEQTLEEIHTKKTASLIAASIDVGALIAGASKKQREALRHYGMNIGHAFQVADDILDVEGTSTLLGKETGADKKRGKLTYPALHGMEKSRRILVMMIESALKSIEGFDERAEPLRLLAHYIGTRKK